MRKYKFVLGYADDRKESVIIEAENPVIAWQTFMHRALGDTELSPWYLKLNAVLETVKIKLV